MTSPFFIWRLVTEGFVVLEHVHDAFDEGVWRVTLLTIIVGRDDKKLVSPILNRR